DAASRPGGLRAGRGVLSSPSRPAHGAGGVWSDGQSRGATASRTRTPAVCTRWLRRHHAGAVRPGSAAAARGAGVSVSLVSRTSSVIVMVVTPLLNPSRRDPPSWYGRTIIRIKEPGLPDFPHTPWWDCVSETVCGKSLFRPSGAPGHTAQSCVI